MSSPGGGAPSGPNYAALMSQQNHAQAMGGGLGAGTGNGGMQIGRPMDMGSISGNLSGLPSDNIDNIFAPINNNAAFPRNPLEGFDGTLVGITTPQQLNTMSDMEIQPFSGQKLGADNLGLPTAGGVPQGGVGIPQ